MNTITDSSSSATIGFRRRNWLDLPTDVTSKIISKLNAIEIIETAQNVCPSWKMICSNSSMWKIIDLSNLDIEDMKKDLDKICRQAVDFSDGQLIEISIDNFATDGLLQYIAERSSSLKRLRLVSCRDISNEGFRKAAAKLPLLEELELTYCPINRFALEGIGKSCPFLNSFKFNDVYPYYCVPDDEPRVIAENMPGLRHLQLVRHKLSDEGLKAILNGCPHLESLDLRQCNNIDFKGDLKKTCVDRVKSLKLPDASMDDYPYATRFAKHGDSDDEEDEDYDPCPDICGCGGLSDSDSDENQGWGAYAYEYGLI